MIEKSVTIINKLGLHARAASKFVTTANGYEAEIHVARDQQRVNAKSIMGVMMLAAARGAELRLEAEGEDAEAAIDALIALVRDRFGEEE
ncbi:MAG: HPr family phosphocarrier protein [Gammaproteobacteria bacterium]|jgi:phosphocarrier protein HPr